MTVEKWLTALGVLCAGTMQTEEARLRIAAYAPMLAADFHPSVFTSESMRHVASKCRFFPAYAEVLEHLREWRNTFWRDPTAALPPPARERRGPPPPIAPPTPEQIADADAKVAALRARSAAATSRKVPWRSSALSGEALRLARAENGRYPASVTATPRERLEANQLATTPVVAHETARSAPQIHPDAAMALAVAPAMRGQR